MADLALKRTLKIVLLSIAVPAAVYFAALGLLIAFPPLQTHAFYLHRVKLAWFKDLNVPEMFGFAPNQVSPFSIRTRDGVNLHAWHVLPIGAYHQHRDRITKQPAGFNEDITSTVNFQILRDDPEAKLVLYLHGTAGCIASGWRPDSYRALSGTDPSKIHLVTMDYRGFGLSTGVPSEDGLLLDAIALTDWAMNTAGIHPSRIVVFAQSLGTAVAISLARHFALQAPSISFAGVVLVASFTDVATLTATYRIGGVVPVLSPLRAVPFLLKFFNSFLHSTWLSKDRVAEFIRSTDTYDLTFIHAEDDTDIPFLHTELMFWHAVNATTTSGIAYDALEKEKQVKKVDLGNGGWTIEWKTSKGTIREEVPKYGLHDRVMAYPIAALAVSRAFDSAGTR